MKHLITSILCISLGLIAFHLPEALAQDDNWATVKGRILWGGDRIPDPEPIATVKGNADAKFCLKDGPVLDEKWVVNKKNKGLRWAFVWLANEDPNDKMPLPIHPDLKVIKEKKVVIDQPCCSFIPHALAMREGQNLVVKNSAAIPHSFKWSGFTNTGGNIVIPPGGQREIEDLVAERMPLNIGCGFHLWMNAKLGVFNHPYFAVTDEDGKFEIKKAPTGSYRLKVLHEGGWLGGTKGRDGRVIEIKAQGTNVGDLAYPPPAKLN